MSVDVSRLAIEVTTTGIKEASTALGGLSRSAGTADGRVTSLTANLAKLMMAGGNVTGAISGLTGTMALINSAMSSAATNAAALAMALGQTSKGMDSLTQSTNQTSSAYQKHNYHGGVVVTTLKAMTTATLAYFSVRSARNLIEQSDAWGMMQAKLKLATGSMEEAKNVQGELFNMAQAMRSPLEDMGKLYTRLDPALRRMGKSSQDTRNMVEGVTLALKLQGATGAEAASTMLQFSQSANAGRLNGAEFNSVAENGVLILRALEDYLGKNQAQLKKMGAEGKLTFDIISAALDAQLPKWRKDFESLPLTFEGAMQRLKNSWFKAVGEIGQDNKLGQRLAEVVGQIEQALPSIVEGVVNGVSAITTLITLVIDNGKTIGTILAGIAGLALGKWALGAVVGLTALVDALGFVGVAAKAARVALAFVGGPVGIITGLLTAGYAAWTMWGDEGTKTSKIVTTQVKDDAAERVKAIQFEIDRLNKRNEVAGKGADNVPANALPPSIQEKLDAISSLNRSLGAAGMSEETKKVLLMARDTAQAEFERAMATEATRKALHEQNAELDKQAKYAENRKDFNKKYASPTEKANAEIEDAKEKLGPTFTDADAAKIREKYLHEEKKGEEAAQKAIRAANEEREKAKKLYNEMNAAYDDMLKHGSAEDKRTQAEKELLAVTEKLNEAKKAGEPGAAIKGLEEAQALAKLAVAREMDKTALQNGLKATEDYTKKQDESIASAKTELATLQDKINGYGQVKGAVEEVTLVKAKETLEDLKHDLATQAQIQRQQELVDTLQKVHDAKSTLGQLQNNDWLDKFFDHSKVADFGNGFADAFGKAGKAVDKVGKSLDQYKKKLVANAEAQKHVNQIDNFEERAKAQEELRKKQLNDDLDYYADVAGAMKNFFKEKTVAYNVFDAFEKGLRLARLAQDAEEFAMKIANGAQWIAAKVQQAFVAMTTDTAVTTTSVANSEVAATASTTAGVAKSFEQLGVWGFIGAAAIIAFMASMGVGGSGGGGSGPDINSAQERQKRQGTGTVLGDDTAKSESISKSLDRMKDNSDIGLVYTSGMAASLRNIDTKMGGLTSTIARISGMTTGKNFNPNLGTSTSGIKGLFGSSTTREITDTGLKLNGSVGDLLTAKGIQQYLDVKETKNSSGFLGIGASSSSKNIRSYQGVEGQLTKYIGDIFGDINKTIVDSGSSLGLSADAMQKRLNEFVISAEISLKDLKGDDLQKALESFFSASADQLAMYAAGSFSQFQRAGEGYFETLTRVATGTERAKDAMNKLGISMVSLSDVQNKNGDVDVELVRQSLMRQEAGTSLAHIMEILDGSMEDLIANYRDLTRIRNTMQSMGMASNALSLDLIRGAGGIKELSSAFDDYTSNFFTKDEQAAMKMNQLTMEFSRLGIAVPKSRNDFKGLVTELMKSGAQGQELAGRLLALSGTFSDAMDMYDETTGERITNARDALSEAYDRESEALANTRDKMQAFSDSLKEFKNNLIMGDLSPLSTMEKYQTALAKYDDISTRALSGDSDAISKFQDAANEMLGLSRQVNASGADYMADFNR
jgi:tape measure domain-containing protein